MYYLDIKDPIINFEQTINDDIYVDKTAMIELISNNIKKEVVSTSVSLDQDDLGKQLMRIC